MNPPGRGCGGRSAAFTLIELLVATSLISILVVAATTAFVQVRTLAHRVELRQAMHNSARILYERMSWELSCLMQGSAVFAIGTHIDSTTTPPTPGPVELVFLRGKLDNWDFPVGSSPPNAMTDQVWSRWYWDSARRCVFLSASSQVINNNGPYYYLPNPERVIKAPTATPPPAPLPPLAEQKLRATLGDPLYASPTLWNATDSDYTDLLNKQGAIVANCTAFNIEVVCQDGSTHLIDSTTASDTEYLSNGQPVDGRAGIAAPATAPALPTRPRLIRLRFTLTEPGKEPTAENVVQETFSFSFQLPALSPP